MILCLSFIWLMCLYVNLYASSSFSYSIRRVGVWLEKKNSFHSIPAAQEAGLVLVTVYTEAGRELGGTYFTYVDEVCQIIEKIHEALLINRSTYNTGQRNDTIRNPRGM